MGTRARTSNLLSSVLYFSIKWSLPLNQHRSENSVNLHRLAGGDHNLFGDFALSKFVQDLRLLVRSLQVHIVGDSERGSILRLQALGSPLVDGHSKVAFATEHAGQEFHKQIAVVAGDPMERVLKLQIELGLLLWKCVHHLFGQVLI